MSQKCRWFLTPYNKLNCRNFGIYVAICTHCPATYVGQTITSFKDRWNAHRNSWKKNIGQTNIDDRNDQAALLKHYLTHHSDVLNKCKNISSAWKVAFVEEPDPANIDRRETHWRDLLEDKTLTVNIQKMVWPRVRWWKIVFKNKLYLLNLISNYTLFIDILKMLNYETSIYQQTK